MPDWVPVSSSNLDAVQYDADTETLTVRFRNGAEYSYSRVPANVAGEIARTPSPGRYFRQFIQGQYEQV